MNENVSVDPKLLTLLACPVCRGGLETAASGLRCVNCAGRYGLVDGVPVLGDDRSQDGTVSKASRLQYAILGNAKVFDFQQKYFGGKPVEQRLASLLRDFSGITVLDIGAGTGMVSELLPHDVRYVWLDTDVRKLQGLLAKRSDCEAVLGDAAALPFQTDAIDYSLMVEVSHHIPDHALRACFAEASRVTRVRFVFVTRFEDPASGVG